MSFSLKTHLFARLRLLISVAAGIVCYYVLPAQLGMLQRLLISWNVLAWLYLTFIWFLMLRTDVNEIQRIARIQDQSAALVLNMVIFACMASLVAILSELPSLRSLSGTPLMLHIVLTAMTLLASWTLLPSSFAMHYAHHHYLHRSKDVTPMIFPEKPKDPGYWDFLYFLSPSPLHHKLPTWRREPPVCEKLRFCSRLFHFFLIWRFWDYPLTWGPDC